MNKSVQQKICDEFSFLEGVVSEHYYMLIVDKALEIYKQGQSKGLKDAYDYFLEQGKDYD